MIKNLLLIINIMFFTLNLSAQTVTTQVADDSSFEAESTLTLNLTYSTTDATDLLYAAIVLKNSNGDFKSTLAENNINPVPSTGTNLKANINLLIPKDTENTKILSAELTNGEYYELKVEVQDKNWNWQGGSTGAYPKIKIVAKGSLGVSEANNAPASIYPNPATDMVNILPINGATFSAYKVIDITGKTPLGHSGDDVKNIDVSNLARGIYFLQLNDYNPIKFIKK